MRKWYSLIDKVWRLDNLREAYKKVRSNKGAPGIDGETVAEFGDRLGEALDQSEWKSWKPLHRALRQRGYHGEFEKISMRRWRNSASPLLSLALPNSHFKELGLPDLQALPVALLEQYRTA